MKNLAVNLRAVESDNILDRKLDVQKTWTDEERVDRLRRAIKIQERLAELLALRQENTVLGRRLMGLAS